MKRAFAFCFCFAVAFSALGAGTSENLNLIQKRMTAGKASLTENGFRVDRILGTANFSPELRFPVQLVYDSASDKTGIAGYGWGIPQLESSAIPQADGVMWTTPWGEKIRFFTKEKPNLKDIAKAKAEIAQNDYFVNSFMEWKAEGQAKNGDWKFTGARDYKDWEFTYKDALLVSIKSPNGNKIDFAYRGKLPAAVSQNGVNFIEMKYDSLGLSEITINGIRHSLTYSAGKIVRLPETLFGKSAEFSRPNLVSVKTGDLAPVEFSYDKQAFLCAIKQGDFTEELAVENESEQERKDYFKAEEKRLNSRLMGVRAERAKVSGRLIKDANFTYSYPKDGKPGTVTLTNRLDQKSEFDYNVREGVLSVSGFNGIKNTVYYYMRHDVAYRGKVRKIVDAKGDTVAEYNYDKDTGKLVSALDLAGNEISFAYNKENEVSEVFRKAADSSKKEPVLKLGYDPKGNLDEIAQTDASGKAVTVRKIKYDSRNMPVNSSDGQKSDTLEYNAFSYPVTVTDVFKLQKKFEYNRFNQLCAVTDPYGVKTLYSFTPAGLISLIERKDGQELLTSVAIAYNDKGQPLSYTDQQGRVKKFERDAFGRVVKEFFPDETSVEYSYNAGGQIASVLDQNKHEIKFDWSKFGLASKTTAAEQLTDYAYDKFGMLKNVASSQSGNIDRNIKYEYDKFKRVSKVTYADGEVKTFRYDTWGKLLSIETTENGKQTFITKLSYDEFCRGKKKAISRVKADGKQEEIVYTYTYTNFGKLLTEKISFPDCTSRNIKRTYDKFGRLTEIKDNEKFLRYTYDSKSRLVEQTIDNISIHYVYTKYGQLSEKIMCDKINNPIGSLKYFYDKKGTIAAREVNGKIQKYEYDLKSQLLAVKDESGNTIESYTYDPAGNILKKTVDGKTTTYTYDRANQLVTATDADGKNTSYKYDAAGRLSQEASAEVTKNYSYGWLDKVTKVDNGAAQSVFNYFPDGQLAEKIVGSDTERFYWDGLALIKRDSREFTNEPAVTGGNPVIANNKVLLNDMLGNSIGAYDKEYQAIDRTAFGETTAKSDIDFFTGKPNVEGLGYTFMFRNYRQDLGKWQTSDPLGYPDGWNNLAYVNNMVSLALDPLGTIILIAGGSESFTNKVNAAIAKMKTTRTGWDLYYRLQLSEKCHTITEVTGGSYETNLDVAKSQNGEGCSTQINWNPNNTVDGDWTSPEWAALSHEMVHSLQGDTGTSSNAEVNGLRVNEINACKETNRMLLENDPKAVTRTKYGDNSLPQDAINPNPRTE